MVLGLLLLATLAAARPTPDLNRRVDLEIQDAELHAALRFLAEVGGFDLVVDDGVTGRVTVHLKQVEIDDALTVILLNKGLSYSVVGSVLTVR